MAKDIAIGASKISNLARERQEDFDLLIYTALFSDLRTLVLLTQNNLACYSNTRKILFDTIKGKVDDIFVDTIGKAHMVLARWAKSASRCHCYPGVI